MTHNPVLPLEPIHARQLLAELAAEGPGSGRQLLDAVTVALQPLALQPVQMERIHEAFAQAVARVEPCGQAAPLCRLDVRVWLLRPGGSERGWGFFLVERGEDPLGVGTGNGYLVELFLYQESPP